MSDRDETEDIIKNPETRTRREWVDRAITGVRRRLELECEPSKSPKPSRRRPRLYVVPSGHKR